MTDLNTPSNSSGNTHSTAELERVARAETLVTELTFAAKRLGVEEHNCDEELFDVQRVDKAKAAILDYIAALNEEIDELGAVAKGCARRETTATETLKYIGSLCQLSNISDASKVLLIATKVELAKRGAGPSPEAADRLQHQDRLREALSDTLDTERYKVAIGVAAIRKALDGRRWLSEPGRGPYAWDVERYQQEFGAAIDEINAALEPLRAIAGDWSDCPTDPLRVATNRSRALTQSGNE